MKKILTICSLVAFACGMAASHSQAADFASLDSKIRQIKESIETQIERVKNAREKSDSEMSLARIRLAEQLRRSQEDLYRQVAALERFREQLADQVAEANGVLTDYQKNWKSTTEQALVDIEAQVRDTNALMAQMEAVRNNLDDAPQSGQSFNRSAGSPPASTSGCQTATSSSGMVPLPDIQFSPQASPTPQVADTSVPETQTTQPTMPAPSTGG